MNLQAVAAEQIAGSLSQSEYYYVTEPVVSQLQQGVSGSYICHLLSSK